MDFITGLPTTRKGNDSIWVIIDRLTKSAHFNPVKTRYRPPEYADLYLAEIVKLHGIPKTIISNRGPQFTAHFWERMHKSLVTSLIRSTAYHPQTSGQTERLNQVLEDMLRACVLSSKGSWESWLPLDEFSYNNCYQESIKMAPFKALYGRKCRTPLNWVEFGERRYYGIDFVNEAEKMVQVIQQHMKAAQSSQKSYADKRRRPLEFNIGDYVYPKVSRISVRGTLTDVHDENARTQVEPSNSTLFPVTRTVLDSHSLEHRKSILRIDQGSSAGHRRTRKQAQANRKASSARTPSAA